MGFEQRFRRQLWWASQVPGLRRLVYAYYDRTSRSGGWSREHPFDRELGLDTSGCLPGFVVRTGDPLDGETTAYCGCQPSIVRRALREIPDVNACTFVDFGCGKGRALVIASEFPFKAIKGVELSTAVAMRARRNATKIARMFPDRTKIDVTAGDALEYPIPPGPLVAFFYNPFGREITERVLRSIEATGARPLYIVSCNPVYAEVFDASKLLARRFAEAIPYDKSEIGFGPDGDDTVVIWHDVASHREPPPARALREVKVLIPDLRAEVVA